MSFGSSVFLSFYVFSSWHHADQMSEGSQVWKVTLCVQKSKVAAVPEGYKLVPEVYKPVPEGYKLVPGGYKHTRSGIELPGQLEIQRLYKHI